MKSNKRHFTGRTFKKLNAQRWNKCGTFVGSLVLYVVNDVTDRCLPHQILVWMLPSPFVRPHNI